MDMRTLGETVLQAIKEFLAETHDDDGTAFATALETALETDVHLDNAVDEVICYLVDVDHPMAEIWMEQQLALS